MPPPLTFALLIVALPLLLAGCATSRDSDAYAAQEPTCALSPSDLQARRQELLPGLIQRAKEVTDIDGGLRLQFVSRPGLMAELSAIIEQERTCCSFLSFVIEVAPHGGAVTFTVSGPPGTRAMLRAL